MSGNLPGIDRPTKEPTMKHADGELGDRKARTRGKDRPVPQAVAEQAERNAAREAASKPKGRGKK